MEAGDIYFEGYDFPKRPLWKYGMDKGELERNENRYFTVSSISINLYSILTNSSNTRNTFKD